MVKLKGKRVFDADNWGNWHSSSPSSQWIFVWPTTTSPGHLLTHVMIRNDATTMTQPIRHLLLKANYRVYHNLRPGRTLSTQRAREMPSWTREKVIQQKIRKMTTSKTEIKFCPLEPWGEFMGIFPPRCFWEERTAAIPQQVASWELGNEVTIRD